MGEGFKEADNLGNAVIAVQSYITSWKKTWS